MIIKVNPHKVNIVREQTEPINEKEIKVSNCQFEFDEKITDNFVKEAYFTLNGETYKQIIVNNECDYPSEVLTQKGTLEIGVVAYLVENDEEIIRYNPSPDYYDTWVGSLKDAENSEPITPTDKEQIEQAIVDLDNNKQDKLIAGDNITIEDNVISAVDTIYDDSEIREDIQELENSKVDKVSGKGLSTNDYTTDEKNKLAGLSNYDDTQIRGDISQLARTKADKSEIPDVSNFITRSVDNLLNYYLKSETYTKEQVNQLISTITSVRFELVNELPVTGESNVIYLVPSSNPKTRNVKDEYIWINNSWEQIGSTSIDLSDYVTVSQLNTALNNYTTTTDLTSLLNTKQNTIDSLHKLSSDLVDDTNKTNKFVTAQEKTAWNNKSDFSGDYNDLSNKPTIPTVNVDDVQIDGTTIVSDGVANIPIASNSSSTGGLVKLGNGIYGIKVISSGVIGISKPTDAEIEAQTSGWRVLTPAQLSKAVKEGVTNNSITLTSAEKEVARNWLGLERSWKKIRTVTIPSDDYKGQTINGVFYNYEGDNGIKNFSFHTDSDGNSLEGKGITGYVLRVTPTTNINVNQAFIGVVGNSMIIYTTNIKNTTSVFWYEFGIGPTFVGKTNNNPGQYQMGNRMNLGKELTSFIFNGFEATSVLGEGSKFEIWAYGYWD